MKQHKMKPHKQYSDNELRKAALLILTQHLGHANTLRFLSLHQMDNIDYASLRQELFDDLTITEIYEGAAEFWHKNTPLPAIVNKANEA